MKIILMIGLMLSSALWAIEDKVIDKSDDRSQIELVNYFFDAAKLGEVEVLQEFLRHGFPVNQRNAQSYTALMMAAYHGRGAAVDVLLGFSADKCLQDRRGHTAVMAALVKAEWSLVKRLYSVDCKAEVGGKTLAQFAQVFGQTKKLNALLKDS